MMAMSKPGKWTAARDSFLMLKKNKFRQYYSNALEPFIQINSSTIQVQTAAFAGYILLRHKTTAGSWFPRWLHARHQ